MAQVADRQATFGRRLRADLEAQKVSVRELGRRLNPNEPQVGRRAVHKYLADKHVPRRSTRARLAVALGFEPGRYDDEDDEEEDLLLELLSTVRNIESLLAARAMEAVA